MCSSRIVSKGTGKVRSRSGFCIGVPNLALFFHASEERQMTYSVSEGTLLWQPSAAQQEHSRMADYLRYLTRTRGLDFSDYAQLYNWSTTELADFWTSIAEYFQVQFRTSAAAGPT